MTLNLQDKQAIITEVNKVAKCALSALVVNFSGISVEHMIKLRKASREANVFVRVVRNTLLNKAVVGTAFECLQNSFNGPTMIAFSMQHAGAAARLFGEFIKTHVKFEIKAGAFEGKIIPPSEIDYLATLPSYEEAIMHFITAVQEVSIGRLIRILHTICDIKKQFCYSAVL